MKPHAFLTLVLLGGFAELHAASISLASAMNGNGFFAEDAITGGFSRINLGDGRTGTAGYISNPESPNYANSGDRDGHYWWSGTANPGTIPLQNTTPNTDGYPVGSGWDLFPRETSFQFGNITFDESLVSATGSSVVPITTIDLSAFWISDPNRTNASIGNSPTVVSDISDHAIGFWFFGGSGGIGFGDLDGDDTLTFTDGVLTSINLELSTAFSVNAFGSNMVWDGLFSIVGDQISFQIDDTKNSIIGPSRFVADLTGTVNAVGAYTVPEPATALLGSLGLLALLRRRR